MYERNLLPSSDLPLFVLGQNQAMLRASIWLYTQGPTLGGARGTYEVLRTEPWSAAYKASALYYPCGPDLLFIQ